MLWTKLEGLINYKDAVSLMEDKVRRLIEKTCEEEVILLEHQDVYTAGTGANSEDILYSTSIPIVNSGRGGKYTYHGPGQRIIYPILNLNNRDRDLHLYVANLEETVINTLNQFGINSFTKPGFRGIWTKYKDGSEAKISAIGVRVKKWVTFHGVAVNLFPDLTKFNAIVPCGIKDSLVTSAKELGKNVSLEEFDQAFKAEFSKIFNI